MDLLRTLVALAAIAGGAAHAGYAQLANPSGFGAGPSGFTYAASANDAAFGRVLHQPNGLTTRVAGQAVNMPAAYRLAANAPRVAAAVIYAHPAIRTAVGIASWLAAAALVWNEAQKRWEVPGPSGTGASEVWYEIASGVVVGKILTAATAAKACQAYAAELTADGGGFSYSVRKATEAGCEIRRNDGAMLYPNVSKQTRPCSSTGTPTGGCASNGPPVPVTEQQMIDRLLPRVMPDSVPKELPPGTPLPVEQPFINPAPGPNPANQPLFVPTGNPVANPNYNPTEAPGPNNAPYLQPGVRIVPSPTPAEPWRVDNQPVDRPVDSPDPSPGPEPDPGANPDDKPKEEQPDLCKTNPDIVACQKLGDLTPETLKTKTVTLDLKREDGFGPANGSCPAPKEFVVLGKTMAFRWDLLCDFASAIRPLLIGFAYLSAALAFMGLSRKD